MKTTLIIFIIVLLSITVKAQTEKTNERLITQMKNGTVPGWKFAPNTLANNKAIAQKESRGAAAIRSNGNRAQSGTLASEQPVQKETVKTIAAPPPIPTQEAVKQDNKQ